MMNAATGRNQARRRRLASPRHEVGAGTSAAVRALNFQDPNRFLWSLPTAKMNFVFAGFHFVKGGGGANAFSNETFSMDYHQPLL